MMSCCQTQILIAEDEPGTSETYRLFLEDEGHKVTVTSNGEECLQVYRKNVEAFDLLILDYRMPVKDGGTVLQEVLKTNPNQKVLIASAYSSNWLRRLSFNTDNVKVLQKPFELQVLLDAINDLFRSSSK
jgi:two-component system cell cycle response regulator CpdR